MRTIPAPVRLATPFLGLQTTTKSVSLAFRHPSECVTSATVMLMLVHDQLVQVFLNLILNAMDATEEGGVIEIATVREGRWLRIDVRDDGQGIPEELRDKIGNRIFGCDDCQLICPWNRYAQLSQEDDFKVRHQLDQLSLLDLFSWSEQTYLHKTEGSPIRRIGYEGFLRNIAIGLGNAPYSTTIIQALQEKKAIASNLVQEHINWAINKQLLQQ